MGSKNRIAKHLLPIILKNRKELQYYVEPFVGGANIIDKVDGRRIGADLNLYLIESLKLIRDNPKYIPINNKQFTELDYKNAKPKDTKLNCFSYGLIGLAGFAYSFGGKWFGGWSRGKNGKGEDRDYVAETHRNLTKQSPLLQSVEFLHSSIFDLYLPKNSIIYCDPPYAGTTKYKDDFNHDLFWQWCRDKTSKGHKIFISEYNAPDDFVCVWSQELNVTVSKGAQKKALEKLFIHESQVND